MFSLCLWKHAFKIKHMKSTKSGSIWDSKIEQKVTKKKKTKTKSLNFTYFLNWPDCTLVVVGVVIVVLTLVVGVTVILTFVVGGKEVTLKLHKKKKNTHTKC